MHRRSFFKAIAVSLLVVASEIYSPASLLPMEVESAKKVVIDHWEVDFENKILRYIGPKAVHINLFKEALMLQEALGERSPMRPGETCVLVNAPVVFGRVQGEVGSEGVTVFF
jgi:hypothetical protein